jgi:hypothetical protein
MLIFDAHAVRFVDHFRRETLTARTRLAFERKSIASETSQ